MTTTPPRRPTKRQAANSSMASGWKPQDPAIERALQLSTFESSYSTEEFIGTLSEKLIGESKAGPGHILLELRKQVAERTRKMETDVRRAEREYGKRLRELDGGFEAIGNSFKNLESRITSVGRTAIRIGEQLESLHQTRSTAQTASLLLSYYISLTHQSATTGELANAGPLEQLWEQRTSRAGREKLAIVLRRLMVLAKDVADNAASALVDAEAKETSKTNGDSDVQGVSQKLISKCKVEKERAERVRDMIEGYSERFEKEMLRLFDKCYRKGNPTMMGHCAQTLLNFNGGASCTQLYVNQHDFFIKRQQNPSDTSIESSEIWNFIGDPDSPPPKTEPALLALCDSIRETIDQEVQIMKAVFPNSGSVMQGFLQRIFAQVLQQHLESLVGKASVISTLAVLRILHLAHSICSSLVEDLKAFDSILAAPSIKTPLAASSNSNNWGNGPGMLSAFLDHALEELYVPWLEGNRYMESESKNLVELYAGLLSRFTRYHETVLHAKPNSLLNKVVYQLSQSGAAASGSTAQAAAAISKYANLFTSSSLAQKDLPFTAQKKSLQMQTASGSGTGTPSLKLTPQTLQADLVNKGLEEGTWEADGVPTVAMVERMLKWHAEAVGRCVELSSSGEVGKNAMALLKVLAEAIGRSFVVTALDSALAIFEQDSKTEGVLNPLRVLKPTSEIYHLWQRYVSTALFPLARGNMGLRREMANLNLQESSRIEGKINSVVQKAIDIIIAFLSHLLTKQKKNDYKPKNDELSFARTITEPCELCCEFLANVREIVDQTLGGKNREGVLTEIGVEFHVLLLDHFKKFPVNPTGGLMLTKDLASYQDVIASFGILALNERFDMLRQLGNSFIVQPNVLRSFITEGHLGRIDARYLRPYLQQRSDWLQFSRSLQLDEGETITEELPSYHSVGHMIKGSRLSTMSGVAGAGMGKLKEMLREFENLSSVENTTSLRETRALDDSKKGPANPRSTPRGHDSFPIVYMGMH
ncbi:hypothetical protein L204_101765 [Cryptococcus depauperatus]